MSNIWGIWICLGDIFTLNIARYTKPLKDGRARGFTYLLLSVWKMFAFFCCFITIPALTDILDGDSPKPLFTNFVESFETNQYLLTANVYPVNSTVPILQTDELHREEKLWKSKSFVLLVQARDSQRC